MSNTITITIELCAEDRARLDKIIEGLALIGKRPDCSKCVKDVASVVDKACECIDRQAQAPTEPDDVQKKLAEVLNEDKAATPAESPKNATGEPKATDHPILDPFPEVPTATEEPSEAEPVKAEPTVSTAELQQLVIALCRAGKKPEVVKVVNAYGVQTVSAIPEDKRGEAYAKLKQLEG